MESMQLKQFSRFQQQPKLPFDCHTTTAQDNPSSTSAAMVIDPNDNLLKQKQMNSFNKTATCRSLRSRQIFFNFH